MEHKERKGGEGKEREGREVKGMRQGRMMLSKEQDKCTKGKGRRRE